MRSGNDDESLGEVSDQLLQALIHCRYVVAHEAGENLRSLAARTRLDFEALRTDMRAKLNYTFRF